MSNCAGILDLLIQFFLHCIRYLIRQRLTFLMYKIEIKAPCGVVGRNAQSLKNYRCSKIGIIISKSLHWNLYHRMWKELLQIRQSTPQEYHSRYLCKSVVFLFKKIIKTWPWLITLEIGFLPLLQINSCHIKCTKTCIKLSIQCLVINSS